MALLTNKCFFCSTNLPKEPDPLNNSNDNDENFPSSINNYDNTQNTAIILNETLYQISYYLQLPKHQIDQYNLPALHICQKCGEISEKLSQLCSDLEVTKMKVNYYLNLLTDQILTDSESPTDYDNQEHEQSNISAFQEIFQEKCLTTLSRTNVNPQLILEKCPTPPDIIDNQPELDDMEDDNHSYPSAYQDDKEFPKEDNPVNPTRKLYDRGTRRCEYCDKMISYTNMSTHKKLVHGIRPTGYRPNKPFAYSKLKERVGCEFCGRMLSYRNLSTHKKYYCAVKLNKKDGRKVKVRRAEKEKFMDKPDNVKQLLQTCEHCGQVVLRERFSDHERLWCPITKGKSVEESGEYLNLEENKPEMKTEQDEQWPMEVQIQF